MEKAIFHNMAKLFVKKLQVFLESQLKNLREDQISEFCKMYDKVIMNILQFYPQMTPILTSDV